MSYKILQKAPAAVVRTTAELLILRQHAESAVMWNSLGGFPVQVESVPLGSTAQRNAEQFNMFMPFMLIFNRHECQET